jgi:lysozyme
MSTRAGLPLVRTSEGLELVAYRDIVGVWTIGYGETRGVYPGMVITADQAETMLEARYDEFEAGVLNLVTRTLSENELGALVSFVYNLGLGAFKSSTLLRKVNANDPTAVSEFARWNMAGGKVVKGLVIRRAKEAALFIQS